MEDQLASVARTSKERGHDYTDLALVTERPTRLSVSRASIIDCTADSATPSGNSSYQWKHQLIQLTWRAQTGFVDDLASFKLQRTFAYPGEGWALTRSDKHIYMSDGSGRAARPGSRHAGDHRQLHGDGRWRSGNQPQRTGMGAR